MTPCALLSTTVARGKLLVAVVLADCAEARVNAQRASNVDDSIMNERLCLASVGVSAVADCCCCRREDCYFRKGVRSWERRVSGRWRKLYVHEEQERWSKARQS